MNKKLLVATLFMALTAGLFAQGKARTVIVGYAPGASSTLPMLALDQDYYAKEGVKVEFVPFNNSADGLAALQAKKIDVGLSFGTSAPLTLVTKGANFVIIAGNQNGGHPIIARAKDAHLYTSIKAFKGKTVGTPRLYTSDVVWRGALYQAGLVPGRDLEVIEFKRPVDVLEAVKSGKVDVGIGATLITARAAENGLATPLFSNDFKPDHPCCRVVSRPDVVKAKGPALKSFIKALLRAEKKFREDPESVVAANIRQQNWTESYARETSLEPHVKFYIDPNTNGVVDMWNYMQSIEYLDPSIKTDPRTLINTSLYIEALRELASKEPDPFWDALLKRFSEWNS
ncbi:MAG: ABC transporter substrate-binding protein [Spirochaetaceae bacterium]|jgi:NitT/TauT family transport system substrate-binding protein|nr:ABC transporter substrate-binding protein [Spirochaetaceae bacterium]